MQEDLPIEKPTPGTPEDGYPVMLRVKGTSEVVDSLLAQSRGLSDISPVDFPFGNNVQRYDRRRGPQSTGPNWFDALPDGMLTGWERIMSRRTVQPENISGKNLLTAGLAMRGGLLSAVHHITELSQLGADNAASPTARREIYVRGVLAAAELRAVATEQYFDPVTALRAHRDRIVFEPDSHGPFAREYVAILNEEIAARVLPELDGDEREILLEWGPRVAVEHRIWLRAERHGIVAYGMHDSGTPGFMLTEVGEIARKMLLETQPAHNPSTTRMERG